MQKILNSYSYTDEINPYWFSKFILYPASHIRGDICKERQIRYGGKKIFETRHVEKRLQLYLRKMHLCCQPPNSTSQQLIYHRAFPLPSWITVYIFYSCTTHNYDISSSGWWQQWLFLWICSPSTAPLPAAPLAESRPHQPTPVPVLWPCTTP